MGKNTSISLGSHFEEFIESSIASGRFQSSSEVIRAGLRLLEEEESKLAALQNAIQEGAKSGTAIDFDPVSHLQKLKAEKRGNGKV